MRTVMVDLKDRAYPVVVGGGILHKLPRALRKLDVGRDAVIITNPVVAKLYACGLQTALSQAGFTVRIFEVPDSERSKSMPVAMRLIAGVARYAADKKPFIIALGGGVVGDLAGFVAAVYKRGIPFVQVPTTLLAEIDSAIGGKVAVDLAEGKNLVGAFYQPRLVWSDVDLLRSLPPRQMRNGLAEAVKYGVICDAKLFAFIEKNVRALLAHEAGALMRVVLGCAAIKARIVAQDEKEIKGVRTLLNFGHTVGHAVETACGYATYHHGEAVALGMRAAARLSVAGKILSAPEALRIELLLSQIGLPSRIKGATPQKVLGAMRFDKKFTGKKNRFVLARGIGKPLLVEALPQERIAAAVASLFTA